MVAGPDLVPLNEEDYSEVLAEDPPPPEEDGYIYLRDTKYCAILRKPQHRTAGQLPVVLIRRRGRDGTSILYPPVKQAEPAGLLNQGPGSSRSNTPVEESGSEEQDIDEMSDFHDAEEQGGDEARGQLGAARQARPRGHDLAYPDISGDDLIPLPDGIAGVRLYGVLDNQVQYDRYLLANPMFSQLITKYINYAPLNAVDVVSEHATGILYVYAMGRGKYLGQEETNYVDTLLWAEGLAPMLPDRLFAEEQAARSMFALSIQTLISPDHQAELQDENGLVPRIVWDRLTRAAAVGENPVPAGALRGEALRVIAADRIGRIFRENIVDLNIEEAMFIATFLTRFFNSQRIFIKMVTGVYVAVARQGTATSEFMEKIARGLQADLGLAGMGLSATLIRLFWDQFGSGINQDNVAHVLQRWLRMLPQRALRLRLTLEQCRGGGLTSYLAIKTAMSDCDDFPWERLRCIIPKDFTNYCEAVRVAGQNPWYGFKKNLGIVASANYISLGYCAKELLVKTGYQTGLRQYGGFSGAVPKKASIDTMVLDYIKKVETGTDATVEDFGIVRDIMTLVLGADHVSLASLNARLEGHQAQQDDQ